MPQRCSHFTESSTKQWSPPTSKRCNATICYTCERHLDISRCCLATLPHLGGIPSNSFRHLHMRVAPQSSVIPVPVSRWWLTTLLKCCCQVTGKCCFQTKHGTSLRPLRSSPRLYGLDSTQECHIYQRGYRNLCLHISQQQLDYPSWLDCGGVET